MKVRGRRGRTCFSVRLSRADRRVRAIGEVVEVLRFRVVLLMSSLILGLLPLSPAAATPVCTDGYEGGPPRELCGGRVFPEAHQTQDYVQFSPDLTGFREFQHGMEYLESLYPRWMEVFTLRAHFEEDDAVSVGPDGIRSYADNDTDDGHDIFIIKVTDEDVPDDGKETLLYSLSIHGDEKGGIEGGVRAVEDLVGAAENGGTISDGVSGYESTTGRDPEFNTYEVSDVLANEVVYFVDFNMDGWRRGDRHAPTPGLYTRGNQLGTDLNRQMPTVGWINSSRNPLTESEMLYGHRFMHEVAVAGVGGKMAYGADVHGESQSRAWADIMYPAGQFDSVKHRRLMSIAERTKSSIDDTLYLGVANEIEEATGGDAGEGIEDFGAPSNMIPTKPARWGTVWDTLGYTDTGFLGDYMATELGVTGMDYEIAFNHADTTRPFGRPWAVLLQENYINTTRAIIKTAMAYAMTEREDFADLTIDPVGRVGYLFNPDSVSDTDENGAGRLPGPNEDGIGQNGLPAPQAPYDATNMQFFEDEDGYVVGGFNKATAAAIAGSPTYLDQFDSLVVADVMLPEDPGGAAVDPESFFTNLRSWVERGGNLVLTDKALHALEEMEVVPPGAVLDFNVYQPNSNFQDFDHLMVAGLRGNARQLSEATLIGYCIGNNCSPMSAVTETAFTEAGGHVVGTTGNSGDTPRVTVGELPLGDGQIRIMGGGLATPTEQYDHRYGLKDYSLTYSGFFILENSIVHDDPDLGQLPPDVTATALSLDAPSEGQYTDEVELSATLTTVDGAPIPDALVTFEIANDEVSDSWAGVTESEGRAAIPARLLLQPGDYQLSATYEGEAGSLEPSATSQVFEISKEDSLLDLKLQGKGKNKSLVATLTDADDASFGIGDALITFWGDGEALGTATSDGSGRAVFDDLPPRYRGGKHDFTAVFEGNSFFQRSSGTASS
jgi:hypothetical protein